MKTYIERLEEKIFLLESQFDELCNNSTIFYHDWNDEDSEILHVGFDVYHWSNKDIPGQIKLKESYSKFSNDFEFLLAKANQDYKNQIQGLQYDIISYIEQKTAVSTTEGMKRIFRENLKVFRNYLEILKNNEPKQTLLIPDTNSLINNPDPAFYKELSNQTSFEFIITPTVLSELDNLKVSHRDENFRSKIKSIIKRLKGYRNQGNILEGVNYHR